MSEWDENAIRQLIKNQVEESLHLDYKRSDCLSNNERNKKELSKDVSAFANSDGGRIIYGVIEKDHEPIEIDGGIEADGKREWIEQVLNSRIYPRIPDVRIFPIALKDSPEKAVFVIEIPIGTTAHQASDLRYYRRFNFQSVPMYDHEIKLVMNRFKEPNLQVSFDLGEVKDRTATLLVYVKNTGKVTAQAAHIRILIPPELLDGTEGIDWHVGGLAAYRGEFRQLLYFNWGGPTRMPFFPGLMYSLSGGVEQSKIRIKIPSRKPPAQETKVPIYYEIYAQDMEPKKGCAILHIDFMGTPSIRPVAPS